MAQQPQQQQIPITIPDNLKGGAYCNNMMITHSKEEFIMDFLMMAPGGGALVSRVIMSPGHMKRTLAALQTNIKTYEDTFGKIEEATEPGTGKGRMGFHP
jgi:hypothetical protein